MSDAPGDRTPGEEDAPRPPLRRRDVPRRPDMIDPSMTAEAATGPNATPPASPVPATAPTPAAPSEESAPEPEAAPEQAPAPDPSPAPESERDAVPTGENGFQAQLRSARGEFGQQVAQARADFEATNEKIKARTGRDLIVAILIGLVLGLVVLGSLLFIPWLFALIALAACLLGVFEFSRALQGAGRRIDVIPQLAGGALVLVAAFFWYPWVHWVVVFAVTALILVWRFIGQMAARDGRIYGDVLDDALAGVFAFLYVPFLGSLGLVLLREPRGQWWVLAFIIIAVVADIAAYGAGLSFGRHPMAPRISPKKTWEGFAGAAVGALAAGMLLAWLMLDLPWWAGIIIGAVILTTATIGDLGESMIKRDIGVKDMSSWLPGHGGVLDRLDSILPSAAAALTLYLLLSPLVIA
ncbi:phosphatidate cytidylyltransferase [Microbacterium sp. ASV49]|uniref:Phosphatidate cytidylyltransferase n=1 Tax=Microbacterium candidum TaxID=3041922 RepID=A0ABT7MZR5_9MICO|nr:phosphatidate cytidylyltransferase [Microbacterium sp. ASV49]MDL9979953.1 phosphatidate cytidylyltransferase [Microbacterium sp. ASV49]